MSHDAVPRPAAAEPSPPYPAPARAAAACLTCGFAALGLFCGSQAVRLLDDGAVWQAVFFAVGVPPFAGEAAATAEVAVTGRRGPVFAFVTRWRLTPGAALKPPEECPVP